MFDESERFFEVRDLLFLFLRYEGWELFPLEVGRYNQLWICLAINPTFVEYISFFQWLKLFPGKKKPYLKLRGLPELGELLARRIWEKNNQPSDKILSLPNRDRCFDNHTTSDSKSDTLHHIFSTGGRDLQSYSPELHDQPTFNSSQIRWSIHTMAEVM